MRIGSVAVAATLLMTLVSSPIDAGDNALRHQPADDTALHTKQPPMGSMTARASHSGVEGMLEDPELMRVFANMVIRAQRYPLGEIAAFVVRGEDGRLSCILWPEDGAMLSKTYRGPMPRHLVAVVHTHPETRSTPSAEDAKLAMHLGVPVWVLTRHCIWIADPTAAEPACLLNNAGWWKEAISATSTTPQKQGQDSLLQGNDRE